MLASSVFSQANVRRFFARKRVFKISVLLSVALALTGFILVKARPNSRSVTLNDPSGPSIPTVQRLYVRSGALWPQLRWNLRALGDRLEGPGKEQLIVTGTLTRAGVASPVVLNIEAPNRITLTRQAGLQTHVITFDGTQSSWIALAAPDRDLVETLLFDTAESFFFGQMKGSATRFLGFRFRPDAQNTTGPLHDIYAVAQSSSFTSNTQGAKLFYFNSDTLRLDLVRYRVEREAGSVQVQVKLTNWTVIDGQQVARRVERWDGGMKVFTLVVSNVAFAPSTTGIQQ